MQGAGREEVGPEGRRLKALGAVLALVTLGLVFGVAPTVGDGLNRTGGHRAPPRTSGPYRQPRPRSQPSGVASNGAAISAVKKQQKTKTRPITIQSRITDSETPIMTEVGRGTYVRLVCPDGAVAVSGGMLTQFINLVISSSGPNNPISGAYTPRTWWITVVNADIDGQGKTLGWRGVVNCMSPVKLKK